MASVNFKKFKTPNEVKTMLRYCDKEERHKMQNYSNQQIDKSLTYQNQQGSLDYKQTCERYDARIAYLDSLAGQNKRKDRVVCFGLEIPFPEGLDSDKEDDWVNKVICILKDRYSDENILNFYVHRDEKHTYLDAETGKLRCSRTHIHAYVVPEIDGKFNGKAFSSRQAIISLNNVIQEMTQHDFGIDFMDGSKKKSKDSVESLKQKSRIKELEAAKNAYDEKLRQLNAREQALNEREIELNEREQRVLALQQLYT